MSRFSSPLKKITALLFCFMMLLSGCSREEDKAPKVVIGDYSSFTATSSEESAQLDELYLFLCQYSQVDNLPEAEVKKMADSIEAFYTQLVTKQLEEYRAKGNEATFEEMLYFLFKLDSKEALGFFAEGFAKTEIKNRIVIKTIAENEGICLTDSEYEELKSQVEVSSYLSGDSEAEIRYELLRRKVLKTILEKTNKHL